MRLATLGLITLVFILAACARDNAPTPAPSATAGAPTAASNGGVAPAPKTTETPPSANVPASPPAPPSPAASARPPTGPTTPSRPAPTTPAFQLAGDPESSSGATWIYRATTDGVAYDLRGILKKPRGPGPFPAVILSHGGEQNALTMLPAATEMVTWGLVAIATNYTHATDTGAPIGSPGTDGERGATQSNILRARKVLDILATLGYVDMNRVAAHGVSNGGFVTTATLATYPYAFRVASHAAAGTQDPASASPPSAPAPSLAAAVRTPYSLHHGDPDGTNPLSSDQRLASILDATGVPHELWVYPGGGHVGFVQNPAFYTRIRAWYAKFGLF